MQNAEDEKILKALTPETLHVYDYLLKRHPAEVNLAELSNHLGLTKPTVLHHIEKLKRVDLIEQTINGYKVEEIVRIVILKGYTSRMYRLLTTWLPITVIFATLLGISITISSVEFKLFSVFLSTVGIILSIYEMRKLWRFWHS